VTPVRRPKLDSNKERYAFDVEREMMRERMRSVLRIAAAHNHTDVCVGNFGLGSVWRNPALDVAEMWRSLLFWETEFQGCFRNIIFAFPESGADQKTFEAVLTPFVSRHK
jgi:uncharacterized protein (TIGR02452 family)